MNDKERLFLVSLLSAWLGPIVDRLAVPKADQADAIGYVIIGIFAGYHLIARFLSVYGPRILARTLDRWFPPASPAQGSSAGPLANSPAAASAPEQGSPVPFSSSQR